jgi:aryl-alcohol dehydrogenase-like predicted oxidoreductase
MSALATKFGRQVGDDPHHQGASRRWIATAVENSLRRLQVDHIDLYQLHRTDPATDVEETLSALTDLLRAGKIRAIGTSQSLASDIVEAQWVAEHRGLRGSAPSRRSTPSSTAVSNAKCCPWPSASAWVR